MKDARRSPERLSGQIPRHRQHSVLPDECPELPCGRDERDQVDGRDAALEHQSAQPVFGCRKPSHGRNSSDGGDHTERVSSQPAGKPVANSAEFILAGLAHPTGHTHHRGGQHRKRNQRQQLHIRGMAGVTVDRPPGMPGQRRPGQNQPARAQPDGDAVAPLPVAQRVPQTQGGADHDDPGHARDHRPGRQHRDRRPGPGRPWLCGCVVGAPAPGAPQREQGQQRQQRQAHRQARPVQRVGGEGQRDGAGVPAGTTQPCCHPLTATGRQSGPGAGARHPAGVDAFRDDQHPRGGRRGGPHLAAARTPRPGGGGNGQGAAAPGNSAAPGVDSWAPSTTNCGAGADQQLLLPRRQRDRLAIAGAAPQPVRRPAARPPWCGSRCARTGPRPR